MYTHSVTHPQPHSPQAQPCAYMHTCTHTQSHTHNPTFPRHSLMHTYTCRGVCTWGWRSGDSTADAPCPHRGYSFHSALGIDSPTAASQRDSLNRTVLISPGGALTHSWPGGPSHPQTLPDLSHQFLPTSTFSKNRARPPFPYLLKTLPDFSPSFHHTLDIQQPRPLPKSVRSDRAEDSVDGGRGSKQGRVVLAPGPPLLGILGCAAHLSFQEAEFTLLPLEAASLVLRLPPLHLLL